MLEERTSLNDARKISIDSHVDHKKQWFCIELPLVEYREVWDLQRTLVAARRDRIINTDIIVLLEHFPVFTLGRRDGRNNLAVSLDLLKKARIPLIRVERGGDITFHGPGQLVVYPIIDLRAARFGVADYVASLEEVMIRTAAQWGIVAERNPMNRGVWVSDRKLGSVGIAIRRGICFHGAALNVNLSLRPFRWIRPCGLHGIRMTSLERELSRKASMDHVRECIKRQIEAVFGIELIMTGLSKLKDLLPQRSLKGPRECPRLYASTTVNLQASAR